MRWGSAISRSASTASAAGAAADEAAGALGGDRADLVLAFFSPDHRDAAGALSDVLGRRFPGALVVGCSGRSCIGGGIEVEAGPSLSVTAAHLPGVSLQPFELAPGTVAAAGADPGAWAELVPPDARAFVLLADPFTAEAEAVIRGLELAAPGVAQIGGLASGAAEPGGHALLLSGRVIEGGAVGLGLSGEVAVDTVVAQGCRPIGEPMFVTRCRDEWILEVDGRSPLDVLNELAARADARERRLFQSSLFVGLRLDPRRSELARGDFLVRNILGADPDSGALAVAARIEPTQVVQFQLRDGETAREDLTQALARRESLGAGACGALLFSCLGRGEALYGRPNHDTDLLRDALGDVPVSGFFCNGEIGPVEGRNFLHGYTSAFGIFRPPG